NKTFKANIIEILILIMCIPRKINFLQLERYGRRCEQRYRQTFRKDFDWMCFNMNLAADRFQYGMKRLAIAIDPSYVSKAGKETAHIGRFWSGCASAVKHGLEILGIAVVDADIKDAMMLRAVQTQNASELKANGMTLSQWYLSVLKKYRDNLLKITPLLVADAAFSNLPFVTGLKEIGFSLISRLRSNAVLYYVYEGPRSGKRGRPKTKDGKIDFANPDKFRMKRIDIDACEGEAYELIAWCKSLKQKIRLVIHYLPNGDHRMYFSSDTAVCGKDVYDIYRTRFQIEFCFRDGHQFTGLLDCQARDEKALDFACNASLAAVNITKVLRKQTAIPFSIGQIKSLMVNAHFIKRFFDLSG
ncbi:transposase, partial [uncultured Allobaculum sp.]|uniref:transposase n=1 Tax=uncultured Allobaculum sp. TaxID=1187017 RepID=UPI00260B343F